MAEICTSASKNRWGWGASLLVVSMALGAGAANAQQAAPEAAPAADETIVVTGYRASLGAAINLKRNATGAVDAIMAEDIANFPDLNLSESIQRIPGVSITRSTGEGRNISVRGLGPQFTRVRIDGMEGLTAVGSTDAEGGTNRSRAFDFNVFASDLFNSIVVRKTASADTEEGSLGATVDLRTARPFDYAGFTLAMSGQSGYNDLSETWDPRAAFLISNRFADNKLGFLLSVAYQRRTADEEGSSTVRWNGAGNGGAAGFPFTPANVLTTTPTPAQVSAAFHPRIPRYDVYSNDQERLGITASTQWQPFDSTQITLDFLYSKLSGSRTESFLEAPVFSTTGAAAIGAVRVRDAAIQGNSLVYGVFDNVDVRSEFRYDELSTQFEQFSLTINHDFTDKLRAVGYVGTSEANHKNPIQTTLLWDHNDVQNYSYDYRGNNRLPLITYGTSAVTNPSFWTLTQIRLRPQYVDNSFDTAYGDLIFDATPSITFRGGVNWKDFTFVSRELRRSNGTTANQETVVPGFASSTPTSAYAQIVSLGGNGLDLPAGLTSSWAAPNIPTAAGLWNLYNTSVFPLGIQPALGNNATVEEEDQGVYLQADWDTRIANMAFRGNLGVRYVTTDETSTGYTFVSGVPLLQTIENDYTDTLPALNMVLAPMDDFLIRFSAAKVMTRPNLGQLNPGASISVSGSNRTVTAGNPTLDPFRATSYDLSFEWYFHDQGLLSLAIFHKDVESFVQTIRETGPFTGNPIGLPDSAAIAACGATPGCTPADPGWAFTLPRNTPGGPVEGYEIGLQLPFFFLPGMLSNFGVLANYTHVDSKIKYVNSAGAVVLSDDLTGLSNQSWNATIYYEDDKFSARVSGAYRSDYLTTIPGRDNNDSESTAGTLNIDFSSSYAVNDRLRFTLEGINLTDEVSDQFLSPDDRESFYHHYGRELFVGFRYKY